MGGKSGDSAKQREGKANARGKAQGRENASYVRGGTVNQHER